MYIYVRNLQSAKTGVTLTSTHIDIKKELSKLNSLKLELGAGILHERINGSEFSITDCDENMQYCDKRKGTQVSLLWTVFETVTLVYTSKDQMQFKQCNHWNLLFWNLQN